MNQDRLEEAFAPLRERNAPEHLRTRIIEAKPSRFRPTFLVAVGAMGIAAATVTMWPRSASAAGLLEQAKRAFVGHSVSYRVEADGKRTKIGEGWYAPGQSRTFFAGLREMQFVRVMNEKEGFEAFWDADSGRISWKEGVDKLPMDAFPSHLDPSGLAALVSGQSIKGDLKLEPGTFEGKPVQRVDFAINNRKVRLIADAKDLRLIAFDVRYQLSGGKPRHELTILKSGMPTPKELAPIFTYNGRTFDAREEKERIGRTMEKPLSVDKGEAGDIAVRKVAMNSRHDLFVLYTGEAYLPVEIRDDAGGTYLRNTGFSPRGHLESNEVAFRYNGKPLDGMYFSRNGKGTPTRVSIAFRRQSAPRGPEIFRREYSVKPAPGPILDFFPFMAISPLTVADLELNEANTQMFRAYNAHNWPATERWVNRVNTLSVSTEKRQRLTFGWRHLWLAEALFRQGKKSQAQAAIKEARRRLDPTREQHIVADLSAWEKRLGTK